MRSKLFFLCIAFMAMSHSLTTNAQTKGKLVKKSVVPENKEVSGVAQNAVQRVDPITGYDLNKIRALQKELEATQTQRKNEAIAFCLTNGLPLTKTLDNGTFMEIRRMSPEGIPLYYQTDNADAAISTRANYLNSGGGLGLDLNGDNLTAHVWDGGHARVTHQEYDGAGGNNRVTLMDTGSEGGTQLNFHAAHVSGTICASGVVAAAKGMAWQCNLRGYMWNNDESEATGQTTASGINNGFGMLISNHSYGYNASAIPDAWFGQYGSDARAWDLIMNAAPYYLMVNSAGNDGNDNSSNASPLDGQSAYDKLNGTKTTKNNLVVANGQDANINPDGSLNSVLRNSSSSEGPTDDYRIKPDIMGNGTGVYSTYETSNTAYNSISGTSMASPNVAGTLLLLQEHYYDLNSTFMRAASLKGLALHTADDAGSTGPDAQFGWGLLNAKFAAETLTTAAASSGSAIVEELTLNSGQTYQITVQSNGVDPLKASISWNDPAHSTISGTNNTTPALVNDLDLRLNNGTTYYPWRLTGVSTNSNGGDNDVDPYERVDINSASGTYTLTVTHEGSLSGGSQDYTLIVTGVVVASTPLISFGNTSDSINEDTNCSYTDVTVPLNIAQAASADAEVTFSVNGSSTATNNLDFEVLTPTVTFPSGNTVSQNFNLRVYHDAFVEGDETAIIDFTVNANGGDAAADTNANSFILTINDDDSSPTVLQTNTVASYDFEDLTGWSSIDEDGDGNTWGGVSGLSWTGLDGTIMSSETNLSILGGSGTANANNYLISPALTISNTTTDVEFSFGIGGYNTLEHYAVYWTTNISNASTINSGILLEERNTLNNNSEIRTLNTSAIAGQTGYFVVRHFNSSSNNGLLLFDTLTIIETFETSVQTAVNTGSPDQFDLPNSGTVHSLDPSSLYVMVDITNNNTFDYGCVDASVSRSGTGAQPYNGSSSPNFVMDKTFQLSPANTTGTGSTTLTFYFEEAEIAGWEAATGLDRNADLTIARGDATSITESDATPVIGSFGDHVTVTGDFTGLDGTYYFGPAGAFVACPGAVKTWNGSTWSPSGAPDTTNPVILSGNFDTASNGNLSACTLTINSGATLTVTAGDYALVNGNITVDGALTIAHQGSVVQVDDDATVANNGTIEVGVTTPDLASRDFMVMGSPMSAETRNGVWDSAFLVLDHDTNNFVPNPAVAAAFPSAENFADDNYDNWNPYTGALTVGEGYIVRPQAGYGQPGGTFSFTYGQGTLNNGVVNFPVIYNGTQNASPNILSNPYPSAIWAEDFINANAMVNEVYLWEHNTPPSPSLPGAGSMNFSMEDISMFNLSGGVAAASGGTAPNGYISTAQGFGIKATAAGTASFDNSMRRTGNNNTLRTSQADRIWLKVSQDQYDMGGSTLIAFSGNTTQGMDQGYDSRRLATVVSLFSHLQDGSMELGIQSVGAFDPSAKIPVGFSTLVEEDLEYTVSIDALEGDHLSGATVYLMDNLLGTLTDLGQGGYTFRSNKGSYPNRFTLLFENAPLGTNGFGAATVALYPNPTRGRLTIASPASPLESVFVHDLQGREVLSLDVEGNAATLDLSGLNASVYFVRVVTQDGAVTKRIVKK